VEVSKDMILNLRIQISVGDIPVRLSMYTVFNDTAQYLAPCVTLLTSRVRYVLHKILALSIINDASF
jgi:hypothetical protein